METYERTTIYLDVDAFIRVEKLGRKHPKIVRADFASKDAWQWARKKAGRRCSRTPQRFQAHRFLKTVA